MLKIINQLKSALITLTCFPYITIKDKNFDLKNSLWSFPLIGLILFIIIYLSIQFLLLLNVNIIILSIIICFINIISTGMLHEDGLADCADSFGSIDKKRKLEIMRDSHIGVYGTLILIFSILIRIATIYLLWKQKCLYIALLISLMISRGSMVFIPFLCKPVHKNGLSKNFINLNLNQLIISQCIIFIIGGILIKYYIIIIMILCFIITFLISKYFNNKIGGFTGDVLGATEQIIQIICMLIFLLIF